MTGGQRALAAKPQTTESETACRCDDAPTTRRHTTRVRNRGDVATNGHEFRTVRRMALLGYARVGLLQDRLTPGEW